MFGAGDRAFNAMCASRLRALGVSVFLPQESEVNDRAAEPSSEAIFANDTSELLTADALIAVLDQETIDAGVACEVGVAYSAGIPVFGLYTDIRQYRTGAGRMYKNLYVLGAIHRSGGRIFDELESLIAFLSEETRVPTTAHTIRPPSVSCVVGEGAVPTSFDEFISHLESWYEPAWERARSLQRAVAGRHGCVLDYGCGTGRAYDDIRALAPEATYIGYDGSAAMVEEANARHPEARWSTNWDDVLRMCTDGFDVILLHFVLHDQKDGADLCRRLVSALRPGGCLHIIDLGVDDLPRTAAALRRSLKSGRRILDRRLGAGTAAELSNLTGCVVRVNQEEVFDVTFPSWVALDAYFSVFDIYGGADLPIGFDDSERELTRSRFLPLLRSWAFPWRDLRVFRVFVLEKV